MGLETRATILDGRSAKNEPFFLPNKKPAYRQASTYLCTYLFIIF